MRVSACPSRAEASLTRHRWYFRYGVALLFVVAALGLRWVLQPWLGERVPFLTFFPAAALLAWYAGAGPAALAVGAGLIGVDYLFAREGVPLAADPVTAFLLQLFYLVITAVMIWLAVLARRRTEAAEGAAEVSRRAVEALELTRAEMKAVLENVPTGIYHLDAEDRFVFVNAPYERLMQRPSAELIGRRIAEVFPPDAAAQFGENNRRVLPAGRTLAFEEVTTFDGERRVYSSVKTPLPLADGSPGVLGLSTDITAQKQAEERLRESEARLREADRRKDEFIAMLSHELRNPLAPILTATQFLALAEPSDARLRGALDIIGRQVRVMARLVDDLLDLSRLTSGRIELRRERVDAAVALEEALQVSRPLIEQARHELVVRRPDEPVYVEGDLVRLAQIVANLVNNAAKYTPPGGRIEVALEREEDRVMIRVADNGIGVPADMIERIFEMYAQVDSSSERTRGGLGIGLTLAQQLAVMHGGRIEARSAGAGRGSTFTLYLPAAEIADARRGAA